MQKNILSNRLAYLTQAALKPFAGLVSRKTVRSLKKGQDATYSAVKDIKKLSVTFNRYKFIIVLTLIASVLQLNGIFSIVKQEEPQVNGTNTVQKVTPVASASADVNQPFTPERIIIKSVNIDLPVVSVPLTNGTWQVNAGVANYAEGTSLVNKNEGNVGIFAHDREDGFSRIKKVLTASDIIVLGKNTRAIYQVQSASVIAPTAVNVFYPTTGPVLTLITCDGVFSEKRYMVQARLIRVEPIK